MSQMIVNIGRPIRLKLMFSLLFLLFWLPLMLKCLSGIIYADANDVRQSIKSVDNNNNNKNVDGTETKTKLPSSAFSGRKIWLNLKPLSSSGNYRYYNVNDNDNVRQHGNDDSQYHPMPTIIPMANNNIGIKHQTLVQRHLDPNVKNAKNVSMQYKQPVERIKNKIGAKSFSNDNNIEPIIEKTIKELYLKLNNYNNHHYYDNDDNKHYNKLNPFDNDNDEYRLSPTISAIDVNGQYLIDLNNFTDAIKMENNSNNKNIDNFTVNPHRNGKLIFYFPINPNLPKIHLKFKNFIKIVKFILFSFEILIFNFHFLKCLVPFINQDQTDEQIRMKNDDGGNNVGPDINQLYIKSNVNNEINNVNEDANNDDDDVNDEGFSSFHNEIKVKKHPNLKNNNAQIFFYNNNNNSRRKRKIIPSKVWLKFCLHLANINHYHKYNGQNWFNDNNVQYSSTTESTNLNNEFYFLNERKLNANNDNETLKYEHLSLNQNGCKLIMMIILMQMDKFTRMNSLNSDNAEIVPGNRRIKRLIPANNNRINDNINDNNNNDHHWPINSTMESKTNAKKINLIYSKSILSKLFNVNRTDHYSVDHFQTNNTIYPSRLTIQPNDKFNDNSSSIKWNYTEENKTGTFLE